MKLRPYQELIVSDVKQAIIQDREICVFSPTGSGKSVIISQLVKDFTDKGLKIVVMVNISKLIPQLSKLFDKLEIKHNVLKAGYKRERVEDVGVHIVMQQTMYSRTEEEIECDVLMIDERHISFNTRTMNEVVDRLAPSSIVGFSATPIDQDGYLLDGIRLVHGATVKELTQDGYLTPIRTFVASFSEAMDYSEVDTKAGDYNENQLSKLINTNAYNNSVFEYWNQSARDRKTIIFCTGVSHCVDLAQVFEDNGVTVGVVHSRNKQSENDLVFENFSKGTIQVLVSVGMVSTGYDEPSISCAISCRPTKSKRLMLQQVGRLARLFEGKSDALWLDFAKNTSEHGLYDEDIFKYSDRTNVNGTRTQNNISGIDLLTQDKKELVELYSREYINARVTEIKSKLKQGTMRDLGLLFESEMDITKLCELIVEIDSKYNHREYKATFPYWIADNWLSAFERYPQNQARWTRAFKTRAKNIVKDTKNGNEKKLASLYYFISFLIENQEDNGSYWN